MSGEARRATRLNPQSVLGIFIVVAGLVMLADNLGIAEGRRLLAWWPVVLVVVGVMMYRRAVERGRRIWAAFLTLLGVWWTMALVAGWPVRLSSIFPLALVVIGVVIVQRALAPKPVDVSGGQTLSDIAFWSGVERKVNTSNFRRADLTAIMGGIQIDFRNAAINGEAVVDLFVLMGGIDVRVPPDWNVTTQVVAVMGGVQDRSTGPADSPHRLVLRGFVLMGGVEVKT
ncbi:MAG: LiaF-related protein [Acidobacteriota bacterium]|jgi:predicted membrane protein